MRRFALICGLFLLALGVRFLTWQDNHRDIWKVQTSVTDGYKHSARQLAAGDLRSFTGDINQLGHPPGYPILLAGIFKLFGESNILVQLVQMVVDATAVVLLFLIAVELAPLGAAIVCGLLAAISPQFAYFSVLLLPDSLAVAPILLAVLVIIRGHKQPLIGNFLIAGMLIGLSCWLRANALLLAPFLALLTPLFVARGKRLRAAGALVAGAVLVIAPITIKNALVFQRFVPLSLGAGQTLLEGIADYDHENRFNIPNTDLGLMRQEAAWYGNPEYAQLLFGSDGIARDRQRVQRGLAVIRSHPFWFAGVVVRRGVASTRLDPVPLLAPEPPVSHDLPLFPNGAVDGWLRIAGQGGKYADLHVSEVINVKPGRDYAFQAPVKLETGRVQIKVMDAEQKRVLASAVIDLVEGVPAGEQPADDVTLPFVSANHSRVRIVISNFASESSSALMGTSRLVELGPSTYQWLRYVRQPLGFAQRLFKTAWILPLVLIGLVWLIRKREWQTVALILAVPAYYLVVQSMLHTERRYVYVIHFFFLILASAALCRVASLVYGFAAGFFATHRPETPKGRFM